MAKKPTTAAPAQRNPKVAIPPGSQPFIAAPAAAVAAAHGETLSTDMDYAAHESMYENFTGMVKWGIIGAVVLVLFLFVVIHPMVQTAAT